MASREENEAASKQADQSPRPQVDRDSDDADEPAYSPDEEAEITRRLQDLGYL